MIVIVSNDEGDLERGKPGGVTSGHSTTFVVKIGERGSLEIVKHQVSGIENWIELRDRTSAAREQEGAKVTKGEMLYWESMFKMTAGVKTGTLHYAKLNISAYDFHKGSIEVALFDRPLLLDMRPGEHQSFRRLGLSCSYLAQVTVETVI
ncbi:hypothetical protein HOY82DRAFT_631078 [Tuber indicum]|nr:hypothetical protein HOY82DRAFT_631078 [Tuber indicum]